MTVSSVLRDFFIICEVVLFYNLLICVHELGHFWAARWRGLVVERFAIWMGPALWKKRINGVEYCLGTVPIGGYVALPQMAPMDAIEGKGESAGELVNHPPISPLDKVIVAAAGPLASFGFALFCAIFVWWLGRPVTEGDATTIIGYVEKGSPAAEGGLQVGDRIVRIDGHPITRFTGMGSDAVVWRIVSSEDDTLHIEVDRDGQILDKVLRPTREPRKFFQRPSLPSIQIAPAVIPMIGKVLTNSPADRVGLRAGDQILAVDGQKMYHPSGINAYILDHPDRELLLTIRRAGQNLQVSVRPELPTNGDHPYLGIAFNPDGVTHLDHPRPWEQVVASVDAMVKSIGAIISPRTHIGPQHLSGPVKIMHVYYTMFEADQPWLRILWLSVLVNINLAVLNMLPIPVLDGGHIAMAILEKIRGKPHNVRVLEYIMTACVTLVLGYIVYVSFYDLQDLPFLQKQVAPPPDLKFSAPAGSSAVNTKSVQP